MNNRKIIQTACFVLMLLLNLSFQPLQHNVGNITFTIIDIHNSKGEVALYLFDNKEGFPGDGKKAIRNLKTKISNGACTVTFENIPHGVYALSAYHDENGDGKFNETWYGKPLEGVAVSNNVKGGITGPPSFEEAKFEFNTGVKTVSVRMNYF